MTVLWSDNLESGGYTGFGSTSVVGTGATLAANAAAAFAGSFGSDAHVNGASGDSAYASSPAQTTTTSVLSAQYRFKIHLNNVGATGQVYLLILHDSADTVGSQFVNTNGTWQIIITNRDGTITSTNLTQQTFTIDTWYLIEFKADWSGANEIYTLYINGTLDTTYTDTTTGTNRVWAKLLGGIYTAAVTTGAVETYTDDYKIGDALIGAGAATAAVFRRSLSEFGTGAGRRQRVGVA